MSGDYSRKTFDPAQHFSGVLMQQGRVQLDADWNEQIDIAGRRWRSETLDIIGRAVVPKETPNGFRIDFDDGNMVIHPGRMYVDGLQAENHGKEPVFDPVLEEPYGSAPTPYDKQPYFDGSALPDTGLGLVYLDVWQREVTYLKAPQLIEPAVGVDTTARWQTVWQVKVLEASTLANAATRPTNGQHLLHPRRGGSPPRPRTPPIQIAHVCCLTPAATKGWRTGFTGWRSTPVARSAMRSGNSRATMPAWPAR